MPRTLGDIIDAVLVNNNISTSASGKFTDDIMHDWFHAAYRWATARHKTPLTEGRVSTTFTGNEESEYPEGWKSDSIRYLEIGGDRYQKTLFQDYMDYRENYSDGEDKIFTDHGRRIFINPNADGSGTLTMWGQYTPAKLDVSDRDSLTVFSDAEIEGNDAIVEEMSKFVKLRERKLDEAEYHHAEAKSILDEIYGRIGGEQMGYLPKESEMFERIDVLGGGYYEDTLKRDQF